MEQLDGRPCVVVDPDLVKLAAAISIQYQVSYWDGAILAAAEALGAQVVYSEDFQHNQKYRAVRVENPFHWCELGKMILAESGLTIVPADDLANAAAEITTAVN